MDRRSFLGMLAAAPLAAPGAIAAATAEQPRLETFAGQSAAWDSSGRLLYVETLCVGGGSGGGGSAAVSTVRVGAGHGGRCGATRRRRG